jgi:ADP-ribose pyrophosphatase
MDARAPVTVISSTQVFQGRVFSLVIDRVKLRNGVERDLQVVRHASSVILMPMPDPQSIVLVRQYRHPVSRWLWEVPAGTLEPGEDPEAGARRECEEETGYRPTHVERMAAFFPTPGYCDEEMIFYRLTGLSRPEAPAKPDEDEYIEAHTVSLAEARAMARRGDIVDMKSALALTLL